MTPEQERDFERLLAGERPGAQGLWLGVASALLIMATAAVVVRLLVLAL